MIFRTIVLVKIMVKKKKQPEYLNITYRIHYNIIDIHGHAIFLGFILLTRIIVQ